MKIYLVKSNDEIGYDEYDAVVVVAESVEDAIQAAKEECFNFREPNIISLSVSDVGIAHDDQQRGAILASCNAG